MIALAVGIFIGLLVGMSFGYVVLSAIANRTDRDTGPLPLMPPPAPPVPADTLVGYQPRHRKDRVR